MINITGIGVYEWISCVHLGHTVVLYCWLEVVGISDKIGINANVLRNLKP